ncbi:MAG TPA: hypothetical protein ENL27_00750, partial [Candidatus Parcubacteria bacterium]|nr:hypothetical protein [Candidatus Parcubacteria bacterium]
DVKLIGMGGGFSYGELGATHYAIEDIAILSSLPNMNIFSPADSMETEELVLKSYRTKNPAYFRLVKGALEGVLYKKKPDLEIGKPSVLANGENGVILASGAQVGFSLIAAEELKEKGYSFKVLSIPTIKPISKKALLDEIKEFKNIFIIEEHNIFGGLGSIIGSILAQGGWCGKLKSLAVPDEFSEEIGSVGYLRKKYKIALETIPEEILKFLRGN